MVPTRKGNSVAVVDELGEVAVVDEDGVRVVALFFDVHVNSNIPSGAIRGLGVDLGETKDRSRDVRDKY